MGGEKQKPKEMPGASTLAMAKGFRGYAPETEQQVRQAEVVEDETLKQLKDAWKGYVKGRCDYESAVPFAKGIRYSASDVEKFSLALVEFQGQFDFATFAGCFLSALINEGSESAYVIQTASLTTPISELGFCNEKGITVNGNGGSQLGLSMRGGSITVEGDVGWGTGSYMEAGKITVNGCADNSLGDCMKGGTIVVGGDSGDKAGNRMIGGAIIVKGNAGDWAGCGMEGGTLIVEGDSGDMVGRCMKGGEIHIKGAIKGLHPEVNDRKIYHGYRQIYPELTLLERALELLEHVFERD